MSTTQQTADFILNQLSGLNVRVRKMFGEYALYCDDRLPAFICDGILFVKIVEANHALAAGLKTGPCYPGSKDYYVIPKEKLEDRKWLQNLIQITASAVPSKR